MIQADGYYCNYGNLLMFINSAVCENGIEDSEVFCIQTRDLLDMFDRSLRSLLDGEMEHSAGLRQETELLKRKLAELEERHTAKVQALAR